MHNKFSHSGMKVSTISFFCITKDMFSSFIYKEKS